MEHRHVVNLNKYKTYVKSKPKSVYWTVHVSLLVIEPTLVPSISYHPHSFMRSLDL